MAPTLLDTHRNGVCPSCGRTAFVGLNPYPYHLIRNQFGICGTCLASSEIPINGDLLAQGDRIFINKIVQPNRWDIIAFRNPENPELTMIFRVVGLPGETVVIKDEAVWINDQKLVPPHELARLAYRTGTETETGSVSAIPSQPARLGTAEYFVLGDFPARANDSRMWQRGAPGHSPFAIPASYVEGVAIAIYWPLWRCRELRK